MTRQKKHLVIEGAVVYLLWLTGQVLANSLMVKPETLSIGHLVYFIVVTFTGILIPLYLCRKNGFSLPFSLRGITQKGVISSLILFMAMFGIGLFSLKDGMTFRDILNTPWHYHWPFYPIFFCTMTAYTLLWFGYFYELTKTFFSGKSNFPWWPILITALLYSLYHVTSLIDLYGSLNEMFSTMFWTFIIGVLVGISRVFSKNLFGVFFAMYIINFFVFFNMPEYHQGGYTAFFGPEVLVIALGGAYLLNKKVVRD